MGSIPHADALDSKPLELCMADLPKLSDLRAATDERRIDFLQTDLALAFTFTDLVKTEFEMGDRDAAQRIFKKAELAYATIARMLAEVENTEHKNDIEEKLTQLRARLNTLAPILTPAASMDGGA
jgi:hypothetical protein